MPDLKQEIKQQFLQGWTCWGNEIARDVMLLDVLSPALSKMQLQ